MLLIGSRALLIRAPAILSRKPLDFDFICSPNELEDWKTNNLSKFNSPKIEVLKNGEKVTISDGETHCEFEVTMPSNPSAQMAIDLVSKSKDTIHSSFGMIPNLDMLFALKTSHRFLKNSPHFWKTLGDWHRMRAFGAKIRPEYEEFLKIREKETYNYKHPSLNQSKMGFFSGDGVVYKYDHDHIHKAIAIYDRPAYTYYMKDGAEVQTDKNKFFACPEEIRIAGAIEESSVLAIERSLVPFPGVLTPKDAWHLAFSKVCSSITSGYFRKWCYENAPIILKNYDSLFWDKFQDKVSKGEVALFNKAS